MRAPIETVDKDRHSPWLGFALDEGIKIGVCEPKDLVVHATPEVLVAQLPRELTTQLISVALSAGKLTPLSVLETAPPGVLAEHLEPEVLWHCLKDVAARAQLTTKAGAPTAPGRKWLATILKQALDTSLLTPADVVRFVPPAEFVRDAPLAVVAELIRSGLTKGTFNPELVLAHLTPQVIAENLQPALAWACITDAVNRKFDLGEVTGQFQVPKVDAPAQATSSGASDSRAKEPAKEAPAAKEVAASAKAPAPTAKAKEVLTSAKLDPVAVARKAAQPVAKRSEEWEPGAVDDDVEVLDEQPLAPAPAAPARR